MLKSIFRSALVAFRFSMVFESVQSQLIVLTDMRTTYAAKNMAAANVCNHGAVPVAAKVNSFIASSKTPTANNTTKMIDQDQRLPTPSVSSSSEKSKSLKSIFAEALMLIFL